MGAHRAIFRRVGQTFFFFNFNQQAVALMIRRSYCFDWVLLNPEREMSAISAPMGTQINKYFNLFSCVKKPLGTNK